MNRQGTSRHHAILLFHIFTSITNASLIIKMALSSSGNLSGARRNHGPGGMVQVCAIHHGSCSCASGIPLPSDLAMPGRCIDFLQFADVWHHWVLSSLLFPPGLQDESMGTVSRCRVGLFGWPTWPVVVGGTSPAPPSSLRYRKGCAFAKPEVLFLEPHSVVYDRLRLPHVPEGDP